jgi:outer membrane protein
VAGAQQGGNQKITFDDAIGIALRQNGTLRQAQNTAAQSSTVVTTRKMALLPSLSVSTSTAANVGRTFDQTEGRIVDQTTQSLNAGLTSSMTLFDGFRNVNQLRAAQADEAASNSDLARAKQTTVFTVASDFLSLVKAQEQLRVQQENLSAAEALEAQIQKLVNAGSRAISDLYQQQATTAAARSTLVSAQRDVELAKVSLIQTLQLDPSGTFDFVAPTISATGTAQHYALDSLMAKAFANRSDLTANASRVEATVQAVKAAGASRLPTVSLSVGYNTAFNSATDLPISQQLNQRRGGAVSVGVSMPLFDKGAANIASQQAQLQEDNARLALENSKQQIALDVRRAFLDYQSAQQQFAAAQAQQKAADLAVSATQQRYQLGSSTLVELAQTRAQQVQAASAVVNARFALAFQNALMSYYTGELEPGKISFQ